MESVTPILEFKKTCVSYTKQTMAVKYVSATIECNTITAIMGPSGCGKSTLLRAVNLMHNLYPNIHVSGEILLNGENILSMSPIDVRRRVGMVFQRPTPFPTMSIYDNVLSGFSLNGIRLSKAEKESTVEQCLKSVALWDEVKDVLNQSTEQVRELVKSIIERILVDLEKAVTEGTITDTNQIAAIEEYRKRYNTL